MQRGMVKVSVRCMTATRIYDLFTFMVFLFCFVCEIIDIHIKLICKSNMRNGGPLHVSSSFPQRVYYVSLETCYLEVLIISRLLGILILHLY